MPSSRARDVPAWLSPLVLLSAAAILVARWDQIPDRWMVHWGAGGVPNGWASKNPIGVFAPLIGGGLLWLLMEGIAAIARSRGVQDPLRVTLNSATTQMVRLISVAISLLFGLLAVTLPLGPHLGPGATVVLALGLVLGAVVIGASRTSGAMEQARRDGHSERLKGYKGLYYSNPEDPRLWVPKLSGLGMTVNFANPRAWPVMIVLTALPLAVVVVALLATSR
jgi:uncharacterized membrane protein